MRYEEYFCLCTGVSEHSLDEGLPTLTSKTIWSNGSPQNQGWSGGDFEAGTANNAGTGKIKGTQYAWWQRHLCVATTIYVIELKHVTALTKPNAAASVRRNYHLFMQLKHVTALTKPIAAVCLTKTFRRLLRTSSLLVRYTQLAHLSCLFSQCAHTLYSFCMRVAQSRTTMRTATSTTPASVRAKTLL